LTAEADTNPDGILQKTRTLKKIEDSGVYTIHLQSTFEKLFFLEMLYVCL